MAKAEALQKLMINPDSKLLLCLDGGGIRGILTLQLLKKIEEIAGIPCYELFDMVAGTSTGGIIAGLIASKKSATEIEDLYVKLVTRVFKKRSWHAHQFLDPPLYDKSNYRSALKLIVNDVSLQEACSSCDIDLVITSKDVSAGEETFFTCFRDDDGNYSGTYKDILLRAVMEATMSAPTYFNPLERFVDGGITTYNNPSLGAIMEAVHYGPKNKYHLDKLTVLSFGTGIGVQLLKPETIIDPKGPDAVFWLKYVMTEAGQDASDMQVDTIRNILRPLGTDFRRFQLSLDTTSIGKMENKDISNIDDIAADWLWDLTDEDLNGISLDNIGKFDLVKVIGEAMVDYIMAKGGAFTRDLTFQTGDNIGKDQLITVFGDKVRIKAQMSNPVWIDNFSS